MLNHYYRCNLNEKANQMSTLSEFIKENHMKDGYVDIKEDAYTLKLTADEVNKTFRGANIILQLEEDDLNYELMKAISERDDEKQKEILQRLNDLAEEYLKEEITDIALYDL